MHSWQVLTLGLLMTMVAAHALAEDSLRTDIEYARVDNHRLLLDLHPAPPSDQPDPLVVYVHGGAWRSGSKTDMPLKALVHRGFTVASVDYRLTPVARFPAQIHDIKAAIRYLRAQAIPLHIDPQRIAIAGSSAGGHLAALVGVTNGHPELEGTLGSHCATSSEVQAIISLYGAANLHSILKQSTPHGLNVRVPALQLLLGGQPADQPELARLASPVTHVDAHDPPLLLIHGDADPQMPVEQSHELRKAYEALQRPCHLEIIPGGKHGGPEFYAPQRIEQMEKFLRDSWPVPQD